MIENIINILTVSILPLAFLLVAHCLNRHNNPATSKRIHQYRIQIEGAGYEIDL